MNDPREPLVLPWETGVHRERLSLRGVTIVVPVYNEERGVAGVIERLAKLDVGAPVFIVAVNDGSKDRTGAVLAELAPRRSPGSRGA